MCGILTVINTKLDKSELDQALRCMFHRGPDYQESILHNGNYLGHNRLAILDLEPRSNQPFTIGDYTLVYNGEVYNYKELISEHKLKTSTESDTEVILLMYLKFGDSCVQYFNGMFAFVIINDVTNEIFAARDRLGIKPLYFRTDIGDICFSSEISSLLKLKSSELDDFGIRQYIKLRMTVKGYTVYKDIKMFPPGYYYKNGRFVKYWEYNIPDRKEIQDEKLKFLLEDSVRLRRRSDVPVGSFLSGGLDSTILSFLLEPDHTWTVGFNELNEFDWGRLANKTLEANHHEIIVNNKLYLDTLSKMINIRKEPLSVPNEILIYLMSKELKKQNTVVLSGEGADELFWGYYRIFKWGNEANDLSIKGFDEKYCYGSNLDNEVIDFAISNLPGRTTLQKLGYFFQIYHLHGLLRRVDNSTMLASVEARVPFVDHRLVEAVAGTSYEWKTGNSFKEPLKRIYRNLIPKSIIDRDKIGFPVPLGSIFDVTVKEKVFDTWFEYNLKELEKHL